MNPTTEATNPFVVLGVAPTATPEEVTSAYRSLAQAEHPDKGGSTDRMAAINRAFEILSDPQTRAKYDALNLIKRLIADKSRQQIIAIRADVAMHIRSLEGHSAGAKGGFGPEWTDVAHLTTEQARLQRHKHELAYLDGLLALELDQLAAQLDALKEVHV
jgi:curved DNA-binding protein CbpA